MSTKNTSFLRKTLITDNSSTALILRITAGIVMFPHGAQFLLGWFGGYGFTNSMNYLTNVAGLPWIIGFMVIVIEFFGSLMFFTGSFTRLAAISMFILVIGMIFSGHIEHGFFMNWMGNQKGEGIEFHLLMLGICAGLIVLGGGKYSIDHKFFPHH
jgi:putative oxidoreductase